MMFGRAELFDWFAVEASAQVLLRQKSVIATMVRDEPILEVMYNHGFNMRYSSWETGREARGAVKLSLLGTGNGGLAIDLF